MELINAIAELVGDQHKVNLVDPKLVIIVDVFMVRCLKKYQFNVYYCNF
jgi:hypothetical protein